MSDREKFEAWYLSEYEISASDDSESSYDWTAWQAATKSALAQPSGEAQPVAYLATDFDGRGDVGFTQDIAKSRAGEDCDQFVELFAHPQPAKKESGESRPYGWVIEGHPRVYTDKNEADEASRYISNVSAMNSLGSGKRNYSTKAIYTLPQPASVPLSDEQIKEIYQRDALSDPLGFNVYRFARSILAQSGK